MTLQTAEKCRDLGWSPGDDAYAAACGLALGVRAVEADPETDAQRRQEQACSYADQALAMLRTAVAKGFQDAAQLKQDPDLDPLRKREDFRKLLADLEAKAKDLPAGK
jgi:hypothetical protein